MLSRKIGIDLGTSSVRIFVKGEGVVLNEPSATAGSGADSTQVIHNLIGKARGRPRLFRPEVVLSVPSSVTARERRAVTEAAISAGARQVWLIDETLAAAIGAGLAIGEHRACAICEIGAGTTEVAVISRSGIVAAQSIAVGGRALDRAIAETLGVGEQQDIAVAHVVVREVVEVARAADRGGGRRRIADQAPTRHHRAP